MKLWGGRFSKNTAALVDQFNASIEFDQKLYKYDIAGSVAHAKMLAHANIITKQESQLIVEGLQSILADIEAGKVEFQLELEDIHMNIETLLIDSIGEVGKKLHTARSRNDQVAVDIRLYLREEILEICELIKQLLITFTDIAEKHVDTIMPGYTHLQRAQAVTLGHHFMAYFQMFKRDHERLLDCYKRVNVMPLGAGALAGTTYATDRVFLAKELGFDAICENSLDAVSDRDFIIEFNNTASIIMMHLSRFCEELIIWNTAEFGFIEMDDAYSTGSSIMPQKKNPDLAELIRGKTGRVYGNQVNIMTMMKALPLAYNKDMQEDKIPLFDTVDNVKGCLEIFNEMIKSTTFKKENMKKATKEGFMNATDVADYLVKKGVPFRSAHEIVGKMVLHCVQTSKTIEDLTLDEFQNFSPTFTEDILEVIQIENCVASKISQGSTSPTNVLIMVNQARVFIEEVLS
ncbi:argininosuccinate lyase [Alkaliphilus metalliredigens QYMF]|uniref:Argininosuccinate lyase n=1 Tax=Alkaliphilus metalliredigens (strain QYMF) TaxID=293826 RepID=ARLY_ALKMQ|nr:argininosuccinate lyase [Alkaliphilus metalliredigens]A6TL09.1 RecName: Full=Argininosuccinate lyase; Short=ASAL; AltName: Full=Arginosuccinase [Alkaliphilus metalliredigens QYMF]ABR46877.1 argininosuccinate lyase [Alkaliphilus metalliredigens QYMF]